MSAARYPAIARWLHWAVALGVIVQLALGWGSEAIDDAADGMRVLRIHFQLGVLLLMAMLLRIAWRLSGRVPVADMQAPRWRRRAAGCVHATLYLLLLLLPASGYVIWVWMDASRELLGVLTVPALFVPPAEDETGRAIAWYVHWACAWTLAALVALHAAAALWHQWVLRDGLISRRML